jgi:hypothetical protein
MRSTKRGHLSRQRVARNARSVPIITAALIVAVACGDPYLHTNPYDPAVPVEFNFTGPDTLFSYGELAQYSVQTTPSFSDTAVQWAIDTVTIHRGGNLDTNLGGGTFNNPGTGDTTVAGDSLFRPLGGGLFQSTAPPLDPATVSMTVEALIGGADTTVGRFINGRTVAVQTKQYRHVGYKTVVLTQRLTKIRLRCPDVQACDTLSVGGTWSVWVDGFDALNRQMYAMTSSTANPTHGPPVVLYSVRDTAIAKVTPVHIRAATVTAQRTGMTWIIATRGALLDSLQLVVR